MEISISTGVIVVIIVYAVLITACVICNKRKKHQITMFFWSPLIMAFTAIMLCIFVTKETDVIYSRQYDISIEDRTVTASNGYECRLHALNSEMIDDFSVKINTDEYSNCLVESTVVKKYSAWDLFTTVQSAVREIYIDADLFHEIYRTRNDK